MVTLRVYLCPIKHDMKVIIFITFGADLHVLNGDIAGVPLSCQT